MFKLLCFQVGATGVGGVVLSTQLEHGDPGYGVCLHYVDLSYVADTVDSDTNTRLAFCYVRLPNAVNR